MLRATARNKEAPDADRLEAMHALVPDSLDPVLKNFVNALFSKMTEQAKQLELCMREGGGPRGMRDNKGGVDRKRQRKGNEEPIAMKT